MLLSCASCQRRFDVDEKNVEGLRALRCECGQPVALGGKGLQKLGNYLLLRKIATGGMGEIYFGIVLGVEGFEREVAIKKMLPHLNQDRSFVDMMVKEAKLTVLLNHPNIVQVYDLSKQNDQYYIAMEYVPGITVAQLLQHTIAAGLGMPVPVAVHIASQLLRGLMYAHNLTTSAGPVTIIHRDITPQNIMVTARGAVKITDFGIARAVNEISTTSPGLIKGKLGYIAPEQLAGRAPTAYVDLFCAAIVLWEMIAGRRLFKGSSEVDTFRLIGEANVPDLREVRGDVSAELMAVIHKALHKEPEMRYPNGDALADALLQAMQPMGADALRQATEQFFRGQSGLFSQVYVHDSNASLPPLAAEELTHVSRFATVAAPPALPVAAPAAGGRTAWWVGGGVAAALVLAGVGTWAVRQTPPPQAQLASSAPAPAPLAPAGTPTAPGSALAPTPPPAPAAAPAAAPSPSSAATPASPDAAPPPAAHKAARRQKHNAEADTPLTGAEIQKTIAQKQTAIARCLRGLDATTAPSQVAAKLTIERSGSVSQVSFEPAFQSEQGQCIQEVLHKLKFRAHPYEGLQVTIPLRLQVR